MYCFCKPFELTDWLYYEMFQKHINWEAPKDVNEKNQWLKFYSDTSKWPELADKYKVREYIKNKGLGHILNELYAVFKNEKEIDISRLPQSFAIKLNNGCKDGLFIRDKNQCDITSIRRHFRRCKKQIKYFAAKAEHFYLRIKPQVIIAEKLLFDSKSDTELLVDYKFYCFHGEPKYVILVHGRLEQLRNKYKIQTFDMDWNYVEGVETDLYWDDAAVKFPKPESFTEMKQICRALSADFPFVRIDLYEIDGRPMFGEMTFTPWSGRNDFYTQDFLDKLGSEIDLTRVEKLPKRNRW